MASFGWIAFAATKVTDGSKWCSAWDNKLVKDGTKVTSTITYGFDKSKCSFQYVAEDNTVGPSFTVTGAGIYTIYINWIEYASKASLGADAILPALDGTNFWLGTYSDGPNGSIYMNPMNTNASQAQINNWKNGGIKWAFKYTNPYAYLPGTLGNVKFYPALVGDY